jgi:hypothetical protein
MRETNFIEKLLASIVNVIISGIVFFPFLFINTSWFAKKIIFIVIFLIYNTIILLFNKNRCVGMICLRMRWKESYPFVSQIIYIILYTFSFSTLLFWIYFPFDLFILNMALLQVPAVILKKTTLHGYLSGNMITMKSIL